MSFRERLFGREDTVTVRKVAIIGEGPEALRLAEGIKAVPGLELAMAVPLARADEAIRWPGLAAAEVVAPPEQRTELGSACLRAGLLTSMDAPRSLDELQELNFLSRAYRVPVRFRLLPLYYPPYREAKRLVAEDYVGRPMSLKLTIRRGKGTEVREPFDAADWLQEKELGFLALAPWLVGPIAKVHARLGKMNDGQPGTSLIIWKYEAIHQLGFLMLDFCPGLHVRTFTEPVHRYLELTAIGGLVMVTRAEGQLLRQPALIVRGKSTTTAFEMIADDWREVYVNLAQETAALLAGPGAGAIGAPELVRGALGLIQSIRESRQKNDEVKMRSG